MSVPDPVAALRADLGAASAVELATRVAESRGAAVSAIEALPEGPCRVALLAWLAATDDQAAAALRGPAMGYGRLWLSASTAYQPPAAAAPPPETRRPTAPEPGSEGAFIGDPRDRMVTPPAPRVPVGARLPGRIVPPTVRTAQPPPPPAPRPPRPVPQGRPPYGQSQPPRRPLGPAPDDDDIPF